MKKIQFNNNIGVVVKKIFFFLFCFLTHSLWLVSEKKTYILSYESTVGWKRT